MNRLSRGDIWLAELGAGRGREQAGTRPFLVVSDSRFSNGPAELVIGVPLTTTDRRIVSHVPVAAPEGGVRRRSFIMCEQVRSASRERMLKRIGRVENNTMRAVEDIIRVLLNT